MRFPLLVATIPITLLEPEYQGLELRLRQARASCLFLKRRPRLPREFPLDTSERPGEEETMEPLTEIRRD
jgi:hypothetical protein